MLTLLLIFRSLAQLRDEMVKEKLGHDRLSQELDGLKRQLRRMGVDWQAVLEGGGPEAVAGAVAGASESERVKSLEGSVAALIESGRKRATAAEAALKEEQEKRARWQQKAELLELKVGKYVI